MTNKTVLNMIVLLCVTIMHPVFGTEPIQTDTIPTSEGNCIIYFIGHGSLLFEFNEKMIHVDPFSRMADYGKLPKADLILITHEHGDHLDPNAIDKIQKENTIFIVTEICSKKLGKGQIMKNGDTRSIMGIKIEAVPAYNIKHLRESGEPFHPPGNGNGYILSFGDKRIYVAGDTENIPEMRNLTSIDVAFLPMNVPYTMTPAMTAEAAKSFRPAILYPYH